MTAKGGPVQIAIPLRRWLEEIFAEPVARPRHRARRAARPPSRARPPPSSSASRPSSTTTSSSSRTAARPRPATSRPTGLGHAIRLVRTLSERSARDVRRLFGGSSARARAHGRRPRPAARPPARRGSCSSSSARAARSRPSWIRAQRDPRPRRRLGLYTRAAPLVRELAQDVRRTFTGEGPRIGYWDLLIAGDDRADSLPPAIYRRLFGEVPLGLSDLYQPRPRLEAPCRKVFETWLEDSAPRCSSPSESRRPASAPSSSRVRAELHGELPVAGSPWARTWPARRTCAPRCARPPVRPTPPASPSSRSVVPLVGERRVLILENAEQLFVRTRGPRAHAGRPRHGPRHRRGAAVDRADGRAGRHAAGDLPAAAALLRPGRRGRRAEPALHRER